MTMRVPCARSRVISPLQKGLSGILIAVLSCSSIVSAAETWPGTKSRWEGFDRYDFEVDGHAALVVVPPTPAPGRPWIWRGEFFGHRPEPDIALVRRGFHVVYLKVPDLFGSPTAIAHWNAFYQYLTEKQGLARKAALIGVSRGGLYCYNWAAENPDKVACIYGDAPVCDLHSWPLGHNNGDGNPAETTKLLKVYGVADEAALSPVMLNPIDRLAPLAKARIPLLHVYGDKDVPVPWDKNTGVLAERYRQLGGEITLIAKPGVGHVHGLDDPTPIVDFIARHATATSDQKISALDLGTRRELFVDRYLIDTLDQCELRLQAPHDEGPVLKLDHPWEGTHAGYTTIIRTADQFLMYYRGISELTRDGSAHERTCLAVSTDGVHWTKPELGLFEFQESTANNIVLADAAPVTHNFCPFLDPRPDAPASERFKAVGGTGDKLFAYQSADGLRWERLQEQEILSKANIPIPHKYLFDSQNLAFWSEAEGQYVCYFRLWDGVRRIARSTSSDFRTWSPAVLMEQVHDAGSGPQPAPVEHLYTNQTFPYFRAPHIYVATAARFFPNRKVLTDEQAAAIRVNPKYFNDTSDAVFMTSRGGNQYDRTFLEGYLRPGIGPQNWVSRTNYPALNVVQTGPAEMSLYVNQDYAQPTSHVRRYSLRLDGWASLHAGAAAGTMLSRPLMFSGRQLSINFSTSAAGSIRIGIEHADGRPIPGFSLDDCQPQIGNELDRIVTWQGGTDVSALIKTPVRLRISLQDADLYAFQFTDSPAP